MPPSESEIEPYGLRPRQAWNYIGCSNSTGYELLASGEIDSYTIGRARRIVFESLKRYVERRRQKTRGEAA